MNEKLLPGTIFELQPRAVAELVQTMPRRSVIVNEV